MSNIIVFPTPKKEKNDKNNTSLSVQNPPQTDLKEENIIPLRKRQKNPLSSSLQSPSSVLLKKPSHNPYKNWDKNQKPNNLIDGKKRWPLVSSSDKAHNNIPPKKPYVFAGTGLSFLLVAGMLLFGQGNKDEKGREIASANHYRPAIKIIKNGFLHEVTIYKNENNQMAVSLISEEEAIQNSRGLDSVPQEPDRDLDSLSTPKKTKKLGRRPNNINRPIKNLKQVWREQEQRALHLMNTGQRKIISIGRKQDRP